MRRTRTLAAASAITALIIALILTGALASPARASTIVVSHVSYRVQPGDWLAKVAREYCTSWREIYQLNRAVIGPNPNLVEPGTLLQVPDHCNAGPDEVYDRGPSQHASGTVQGDVYTVAPGDTFYSIGVRFGVSVQELQRVNRTSKLLAGQRIVIPGLGPAPQPPIEPGPAFITIDSPASGANVGHSFTVSGRGGNLYEGNVVVRALDQNGNVLTEQATTLQGPNVGIGGEGNWSVDLSVSVSPNTSGTIVAYSPGSSAQASVSVYYGGDGDTQLPPRSFSPGECTIYGRPNSPLYQWPDGPEMGGFIAGGAVEALQRVYQSGQNWYMIQPEADMGNPPQWAPASSLSSVSPGCLQ